MHDLPLYLFFKARKNITSGDGLKQKKSPK